MELRQSYSVDQSEKSAAAAYLAACLKWEHGAATEKELVRKVAESLLHELRHGA
jgi:hypothetical protein